MADIRPTVPLPGASRVPSVKGRFGYPGIPACACAARGTRFVLCGVLQPMYVLFERLRALDVLGLDTLSLETPRSWRR